MFQGFQRAIGESTHLFRQRVRTRKRIAALRPMIEGMEERTLLATITWTGATSSDWDTMTNWSPQQVPNAMNSVVIPANSGTITHASSTNDAVLSLTMNGGTSLNLTNGSIALVGNLSSSLDNVTVGSGAAVEA